eukprot:CAMPEP_0179936662 /NCGR_PEP_ID=MMETSP0983-20121128/13833_1 /TAXON_ID=483367 /ORGANISM="non described non described, Strain CCMP 2436" /LENGTH=94 /DNA_ID=CAMNT_0021842173 /DNA_START=180 /DNA_END=461 /DNA_ORIENTATION=-
MACEVVHSSDVVDHEADLPYTGDAHDALRRPSVLADRPRARHPSIAARGEAAMRRRRACNVVHGCSDLVHHKPELPRTGDAHAALLSASSLDAR